MSLLEELQHKKTKLKSTETIVTNVDGTRYLETKAAVSKIESKNYGFVVDNKLDDKPAKILEYLYLGSQDCCFEKTIQEYNIKNVLSIGIEAPIKIEKVQYNFISCLDLPETNIWDVINKACSIINLSLRNKEVILVHCNAGISRSASVIIGYLMLNFNFNFSKAFEHVRLARNCIKPNCGFESQLKM